MRTAPFKRRVPLAADLPRVTGYYNLLNRVVGRGYYGAVVMRRVSGARMMSSHELFIMRVVIPRRFGAVMMRRVSGALVLGRRHLRNKRVFPQRVVRARTTAAPTRLGGSVPCSRVAAIISKVAEFGIKGVTRLKPIKPGACCLGGAAAASTLAGPFKPFAFGVVCAVKQVDCEGLPLSKAVVFPLVDRTCPLGPFVVVVLALYLFLFVEGGPFFLAGIHVVIYFCRLLFLFGLCG